ncbi:hypothetical protein B0T20DRAFT_218501 [Sordaria brevicollis]|uniref:SNF2 N-terminal domain-containing protein n=1 Tax=Sordaria brevicollis TaxID=83679 RepID=A0AAE0UC96_SORBR|nr:hypothetical protein B0T20DRAFT_218501 [Sordaria brevicollis]
MGTGKTLIYSSVLFIEHKRLCDLEQKGEAIQAYPSIVVLPPSLVPQTFEELHNTFGDLRIYCWYVESSGIPRHDPRHDKTLNQGRFDELMARCVGRRHKADTARVVIIAAFTTINWRWGFRGHKKVQVPWGNVWHWARDVRAASSCMNSTMSVIVAWNLMM